MKLGIIGLGKMGLNLAINAINHKYEIVAFDKNIERIEIARENSIAVADSYEELVSNLPDKKILWLMIPSGSGIDTVIDDIKSLLKEGDIIVDGGNSFYKDSIRRAKYLNEIGVDYLDAGVSGGISGALEGACVMIGGKKDAYDVLHEFIKDIAVKDGYLYTGESGSGHFAKMIHNGIEYGMMQAIGEGFEVLEKSSFNYDYISIAKLWNNGSVIRGWLMELTQSAFSKDSNLDGVKGVMYSSGEGQWTAETALELKVPTPVITTSVMMRYRSEQEDSFTGKVVASLRNEFGGHAIKKS